MSDTDLPNPYSESDSAKLGCARTHSQRRLDAQGKPACSATWDRGLSSCLETVECYHCCAVAKRVWFDTTLRPCEMVSFRHGLAIGHGECFSPCTAVSIDATQERTWQKFPAPVHLKCSARVIAEQRAICPDNSSMQHVTASNRVYQSVAGVNYCG